MIVVSCVCNGCGAVISRGRHGAAARAQAPPGAACSPLHGHGGLDYCPRCAAKLPPRRDLSDAWGLRHAEREARARSIARDVEACGYKRTAREVAAWLDVPMWCVLPTLVAMHSRQRLTQRQIATRLGVSPRTVERYAAKTRSAA